MASEETEITMKKINRQGKEGNRWKIRRELKGREEKDEQARQ